LGSFHSSIRENLFRELIVKMMFNPPAHSEKPLVFAHRGASKEYPENTILSFDMAIKQGAVGIETDLQFTKDLQIVCFHDRSLGRTSNLEGDLYNVTLKELSAAKIRHNSISDQKIPTITALLEWLPKETCLMVELKDPRFSDLKNLEVLVNLLSKYNVLDKTILSSFSEKHLAQAKKLLPAISTCFIMLLNLFPNLHTADGIAPYYPSLWLNPFYTKMAHNNNKFVSVCDPHPENRIKHYIEQQVDILTGDSPNEIFHAISAVRHEK
jgi:glycerophosphoryl diester phosphodiesterase